MEDFIDENGIQVVVLDIEGTICSILFVKDVLYPYFNHRFELILEQLEYPLVERPDEEANKLNVINNIVRQFPMTNSFQELVGHIKQLVEKDIKDPVLKAFQGFVWQLGYEKGDIVAPIYGDAIDLISSFASTRGKVYIYSSGSVKAQKLLFNYVKHPSNGVINMNKYLSGYFDITTSGYKQEKTSYENILGSIGYTHDPKKVLFLSDNVNEIKAATEAGLKAIIVSRPGNEPVSDKDAETYGVITDFNDVST